MREPTAGDVMNTQVLAVEPDMSVKELASFLIENQISGAPVLDAHGRLVGVVSLTDIVESESEGADPTGGEAELHFGGRWQRQEAEAFRGMHLETPGLQVRDIMTPTAFTLPHDTPVPKVARTMVAGRIHRLLVTREQRVVGIVTSLDLLKLLARREAAPPAEPRRSVIVR
jgi:CBS domain-containing protein